MNGLLDASDVEWFSAVRSRLLHLLTDRNCCPVKWKTHRVNYYASAMSRMSTIHNKTAGLLCTSRDVRCCNNLVATSNILSCVVRSKDLLLSGCIGGLGYNVFGVVYDWAESSPMIDMCPPFAPAYASRLHCDGVCRNEEQCTAVFVAKIFRVET